MIKHDKFGDDGFTRIYSAYAQMDVVDFRKFCINEVKTNSCSSQVKKDGFCRELEKLTNKDRIVSKVTNFFMAGEGYKVIKV